MPVDDLPHGWRMSTGVQSQRSEWKPGASGVTTKGRTKNFDNPPIHATDENTEGELGGKPPAGSAHVRVSLSPCPLLPQLEREFWEG